MSNLLLNFSHVQEKIVEWASLFPFFISLNIFSGSTVCLWFCILTNSQYVMFQTLNRVQNLFHSYSMSESNQTLWIKVCCKYHLHRNKVLLKRTTSRQVYPCDIHCRCIIDSLCTMGTLDCKKTNQVIWMSLSDSQQCSVWFVSAVSVHLITRKRKYDNNHKLIDCR